MASGGVGRGLGGLDQVSGNAVIGPGVLETRLAGGTGLGGAVGAGCGAVAFIVGGDVQRGQEGLDLVCWDGGRRPGLPVRTGMAAS